MRRVVALLLAALVFGGCATVSGARHYERGSQALEAGDTERAIAHLERAVELAPEISAIHNHLGIAYQADGQSKRALAAYERALDLDCDNRAAQHNLDALRERLAIREP